MSFPESYPIFHDPNDSIDKVFSKFPYSIDKVDQSVAIPNTYTPGYSPIFRNQSSINQLLTTPNHKVKTLYDLFEHNVNSFANKDYLGERPAKDGPYKFITYKETKLLRNQLGSAILQLLKPHQIASAKSINDFILSIYAPNRYEWSLLDFTCHAFSITSTALYDTLGPESIQYILQITETPILFLTYSKIHPILNTIKSAPDKFQIKFLISLDPIPPNSTLYTAAQSLGIVLHDFNHLISLGRDQESHQPLIPPSPSTPFSITFTSGTSGTPKGVLLTHANIMAAVLTIYSKIRIEPDPKHFVFLPLPHILQRVNLFLVSVKGGRVYFPHDGADTRTFFADILECKPTHMASVPRVYNKIESIYKNKIYGDGAEGWLKNKLAQRAIGYKVDRFIKGNSDHAHWLYDRLIHRKLRSLVGFDNVEYFVSGAAPIHGDTLNFIKAVFNVGVFVEAYGSTETCGGILMNSGKETKPGSVGSVSPTTEFRLQDVEEMGYGFLKNRTGELLVRGPQIFKGYYKDETNTKEAFDDDGWYKTGDIVKVDTRGKVSIIDRRKNFFKLSQGEYIAPENIENKYISNNSDLITQIWCYGNSLQNYLIGFIGIDLDNLKLFLEKNKVLQDIKVDFENRSSLQNLFHHNGFKKLVLNRINSKMDNLQGFEKLKNIYIDFEPLTVENGTMTPTLKVKRFVAKNFYKNEIHKLYEQGQLFGSKL